MRDSAFTRGLHADADPFAVHDIVGEPQEGDIIDGELVQYVIYEKPKDFPDGFVVRKWYISAKGMRAGFGCYCWALDNARECVPDGLVNIGRMGQDDPAILEVWT